MCISRYLMDIFFFIIRQFVAYVYDLNHVENLHQEVFDFCSYLNQVPY